MTGVHGGLRLIFIYFPDKRGRGAFGRFLSSHSPRIIHDGIEPRESSGEGKTRDERGKERERAT